MNFFSLVLLSRKPKARRALAKAKLLRRKTKNVFRAAFTRYSLFFIYISLFIFLYFSILIMQSGHIVAQKAQAMQFSGLAASTG